MASKAIIIGIVVFLALVGAVVIFTQFGSNGTDEIACSEDGKSCPDGTVVGRVPPSCEFAPCPNQTFQEEPPTEMQSVTEYIIEADDRGFYMNGADIDSISAPIGASDAAVKITFKVRTTNVYYGGLQFKGCGLDTGKVSPGGSITVEFTAASTCTITSYWPSSSRVKDNLQVVVG